MTNGYLHSIILDLQARNAATLPATMGHQAHALFLDLIGKVDPALAARLHDEPNYRPFTVSPLYGVTPRDGVVALRQGQPCSLRLTLLDGGRLWECLSSQLLRQGSIPLRLGAAELDLRRLLATPGSDPGGWAAYADWQTLAATPARRSIAMRFSTPTSFNLGNKRFALFPEPVLLWESFVRVWNNYAPPVLKIDRLPLSDYIRASMLVSDYDLHTALLTYPTHVQKGFVGTCTYRVDPGPLAGQVAALAEFARYSGVGYKTTMGMGQVRAE